MFTGLAGLDFAALGIPILQTTIGTGIVFCAQSSQFQICRSVPQIAVLRIRIMTSLCPTSGFLTRVSVSPGARPPLAAPSAAPTGKLVPRGRSRLWFARHPFWTRGTGR